MGVASRRVLITGANRGLGLGFAQHYLAHGWDVVATTVTSQKAETLAGMVGRQVKCLLIETLDVARQDSVEQLARRLEERGLRLDLIVSNAGVSSGEGFGEWTAGSFERHFRVNATGPALLAQALAPLMNEGAKLINVSSGIGSMELNINPTGELDAYAMSKAALNILSRRLAAKLEPQGITVVAMNPGWVRTDMGGAEAPASVEEAIGPMAATIESLRPEQSGSYLSKTGDVLPW